MADVYRTFIGFVKFDPNDGDAGGKPIRKFVLRATGVKEQAVDISATLWPSHDGIEIAKGDAVLVEGKFSVNKVQKDGETKTYFNLSVSNIINLGEGFTGERAESVNDGGDAAAADDDIPY